MNKHSGYTRDGRRLLYIDFGGSDPPPPPDYAAAANATAAGNLEAAKYATEANRVNQYTPYGSSTYQKGTPGTFDQAGYGAAMAAYKANPTTGGTPGTPGHYEWFEEPGRNGQSGQRWVPPTPGTPGTAAAAPTREQFMNGSGSDQWSQTISLSPEQQVLYDKDLAIKGGLADVATQGLGYVQATLNTPFDQRKLVPEAINPGETAQAALLRRMQPQLDRDREGLRTQLLNQGLTQGSEAYDDAMERSDRQANDAYSQAALQGIGLGQQARQQGIQEQSFFRNEPVNMLNAVRSGAQIQNPTFSAVPQQATTAGPDLLGAATQGYNAQLGATNAQNASSAGAMGGLFNLGAAAMPFMFSDERLKTNIKRVGELPNGIGIYSFSYKDNPQVLMLGCIAQDVEKIMPDAVSKSSRGFLMVNYSKVLA